MAITNPSDGTLTSLKAERRPLVDAQGATTGNYAWVAQDESLKANLKTEHGDYQRNAIVDSGPTSRSSKLVGGFRCSPTPTPLALKLRKEPL